MKALVVIPGSERGLEMIFARRQADSIERAGVTVRRFFLGSRTSAARLAADAGRYRAEIAAFAPDVVHGHYGSVAGFFATHATARPVVITFHGSDLNPCPSIGRLRWAAGHALSQLAARRARRIVCVSEELRGRLRWGHGRAVVIPMGVDTVRFSPVPRQVARDRLGWAHDDPVALFNAGQDPLVKRLDLAEAAFAAARARRPDLRLVVMRGDVPPDDVPLHMAAADVLLCTSDFEGSPMAVKEAIACGLPVASYAVGDVGERLAHVTPSRIVARDPAALAAAIVELAADGRRSDGPAVAAREFSEGIVASRVVAVLEDAAGLRGAARNVL